MTKPELIEILEEVLYYFEDRTDADHDGERFVANTEMRLMDLVDKAIAEVKRS